MVAKPAHHRQLTAVDEQAREPARLVEYGLALLREGKLDAVARLPAVAQGNGVPDPRLLVLRAFAHGRMGLLAQALKDAETALKAPLAELWALDLLGNTFTLCHRPDEAYRAFSRAREAAPDRPDVLFNFAAAAAFLGRTEEAEDAYDRVIGTDPTNGEACLNRSQLRRQTTDRNHVPELRAALAQPLPWEKEAPLRYALGKELEDLGEYDEAFANFAAGASVRRRHMRYSVDDDVQAMEQIAAAHDAKWCRPATEPHPRTGPIFILGMPRSGSTLLERMLGRHSEVQALGELPAFGQAVVATFRDHTGRMPTSKRELIESSAGLPRGAIGQRYRSMIAPLRDGRPRFTDKLPINFLYCGLIARELPDATLLHIRRDPLDLCFAVFKTLFRDAYPFSYDLAELGAYHQGYGALMGHWREALGERLVEVDYEDLVSAPGETLKVLLPRLGLDAEDDCLNPELDRSAVMTASASQVRQPIHTRSVGAASRYERHLGPLRAALAN